MSAYLKEIPKLNGPAFESLSPKSRACLDRLVRHQHGHVSLTGYPSSKLAAVLILLYEKAGVLRTALPGGKVDPEDVDLSAAAFREANEEVALPLNCPHVHILCYLRPFLSLYKLLVTPLVAVLTDLSVLDTLAPSEEEVDRIFDHPLEALLEPSLARNEFLSAQGGENWPYTTEYYNTSDRPTAYGSYRMHRFRSCYTPIKGLTSDILITAAEIAYGRAASYERFAPDQISESLAISRAIEEYLRLKATKQEVEVPVELSNPSSYTETRV